MTDPVPGTQAWLDQVSEPIIDPDRTIVDPHHHLWERASWTYLLEDLRNDTESGHRVVQAEYEAEMALIQQRHSEIEEMRWAIELEERTVYEQIEANNAEKFAEIKIIEDGMMTDIKDQMRVLELELRTLYATQREIELKMDDARRLVEDRQRQLEDNVLDLLEVAAGSGLDSPTGDVAETAAPLDGGELPAYTVLP